MYRLSGVAIHDFDLCITRSTMIIDLFFFRFVFILLKSTRHLFRR